MEEMNIIDVEAYEVEENSNESTTIQNESKIEESKSEPETAVQKEVEQQMAVTVSEIVSEEKRDNSTTERYTSNSKSKTYSSVKKDDDIFGEYSKTRANTNYYDEHKTNYISNNGTKNILLIIILLATSPVWIPVVFSTFGIIIGVICAVFGAVFGIGVGGLGVVVAGVSLFVIGICKLLLQPMVALALVGGGLLLTGLGLACATVMFGIGFKVIPALITLIGKGISGIVKAIGGKRHE